MKRMMTLLLAAVLTAALWAGTPLPVQAANEFTPDIVYEQTSFIDTTDWLMVVGQDHVLWVYPSPSSADQASLTDSGQALMNDVDMISLRERGVSRDVFALKTDGSLWHIRDTQYDGNDYSKVSFAEPVQIMNGVKEIRDEYALTKNGVVIPCLHTCPNMIGITADAAEAFTAQYPRDPAGQASESGLSPGKSALSETRIPLTAFSSFA